MQNALAAHQALYERTDGRIGHWLPGARALLLRTTGRRSGRTRTSALVYARNGDDYLVVASNGGAARAPGWLHNLRDAPRAEIQVGRRRIPVGARVVWPHEREYSALWEVVNGNNKNRYRAYQGKTNRPIPVVVLTER